MIEAKTINDKLQQILNEFGMEHLLLSLISLLDSQLSSKEEQYLRELQTSLCTAYFKYKNRYSNDQE